MDKETALMIAPVSSLPTIAEVRQLSPTRREFIRFPRKVDTHGDRKDVCWTWLANTFGDGRGQVTYKQKKWQAHKWLYCALRGNVPQGMELDHLCRNGLCVNPYHLEPVTHRVNLLRGRGWAATNAQKAMCPQGHPYTPENTYTWRHSDGSLLRYCCECKKRHAHTSNGKAKALRQARRVNG